ncbi:MAG TPA: hypothetical protein VGP94_07750 [Tepidisphaeraceae bacterium]|nr:hypothetical protein [Tepidisphaeraceae bacterium]
MISLGRAVLVAFGAASLVLFLLALYLWVRSYFIAEVIYFNPRAAPEEFASPMPNKPRRWELQWNVSSCAGKAQIVRRNLGVGEASEVKIWHLRPDDPHALTDLKPQDPLDMDWHVGGVKYFRSDRRYVNQPPMQAWVWGFLIVTVPYWLLAIFTAILPAIVGAQLAGGVRRRRRIARGMCPGCGYDLRASSGICPECGTKVETTGAALRR